MTANALLGVIIGVFCVGWGATAMLYIRARPEKLSGMSYPRFRQLCFFIIVPGLSRSVFAPFALR